jgi:quinol monooxygenase YgiN
MLIRIVRMTFRPDCIEDFRQLFDASKNKIRAFPGCLELQLHCDYNQPNIFITYSKWENEAALNAYRASVLFESVWPYTKEMFLEPAVAFSNVFIEKID